MTTRLPSPGNVWNEAPIAGVGALSRMYWHYDSGTSTWTLTRNQMQENGVLADLTGTFTFTLEPLVSVPPATTVLAHSRRTDGTIIVY